jgi:hypothetical protein
MGRRRLALLGTFQEKVVRFQILLQCHSSKKDLTTMSVFSMIALLLRSIWRNKASLKVMFSAWTAALVKILTMDNLRKRHLIVVDW